MTDPVASLGHVGRSSVVLGRASTTLTLTTAGELRKGHDKPRRALRGWAGPPPALTVCVVVERADAVCETLRASPAARLYLSGDIFFSHLAGKTKGELVHQGWGVLANLAAVRVTVSAAS